MTGNQARVLYLLEYGTADADALRAVASLVGDRPYQVRGLYVEDEDLMSAARLPGFVEVSVHSQEPASLGQEDMQRALHRQASAARRLFEAAARALQIDYSFRVSRGRVIDTLNQLGPQNDVVVIARPLRHGWLRTRPGGHYTELAMRPRDVLFVNEPWHSGTSVVAVCSAPAAAMGGFLERARSIATAEDVDLIVASPHEPVKVAEADQTISLPALDEEAIIELCRQCDARLLIVPEAPEMDASALVSGLLDKLSCSLLVTASRDVEGDGA